MKRRGITITDAQLDERIRNLMHGQEVAEWFMGLTPIFKHDDLPLVDARYDVDGNLVEPDLHLEEEAYE